MPSLSVSAANLSFAILSGHPSSSWNLLKVSLLYGHTSSGLEIPSPSASFNIL
jgi:hypothetical protein